MSDPRTFPRAVEEFLRQVNLWDGLDGAARSLLQDLGVKLEPFALPLTATPDQNDIRGFELLALGPGRKSYFALCDRARQLQISPGLLGTVLVQVALLTADALVLALGNRIKGPTWAGLCFSVNVDGAMLGTPAFRQLLETRHRPAYRVLLEASENLRPEDAPPLREILDDHAAWLGLALDDSDELSSDTRLLLNARVQLVKADGRYVRKLYKDRDMRANYMLSRLQELCRAKTPFVAEGIETAAMRRYLHDRWDRSAHGELWMQGWHMQLASPWAEVLHPLNSNPSQPEGYVLPATGGAAAARADRSAGSGPAARSNAPAADPAGPAPEVDRATPAAAPAGAAVPPIAIRIGGGVHGTATVSPPQAGAAPAASALVEPAAAGPDWASGVVVEAAAGPPPAVRKAGNPQPDNAAISPARSTKRRIVALADAWGTRHGGINAFNTGLLKALGQLLRGTDVDVVCLVESCVLADQDEAKNWGVCLRATGKPMIASLEAVAVVPGILDDAPTGTTAVWLGHDDKTGHLALALRDQFGGQAALIHHMAHGAYQGHKTGDSQTALAKEHAQRALFAAADLCYAVGPLLRDQLTDLVSTTPASPGVTMLVPGLENLGDYGVRVPDEPPKIFRGFAAGRLGPEDDRIKQGRLAFRAFGVAVAQARQHNDIPALANSPSMCLMGVKSGQEHALRQDIEGWAGAALQVKVLPFDEDRAAYFRELAGASFAMMLSWHEGFGLTGWEAIAAGVPLILGRNSGLYRFLEEEMRRHGAEMCLFPLHISGHLPVVAGEENHTNEDVEAVAKAIRKLAIDPQRAKRAAMDLRAAIVGKGWTWERTARDFLAPLQLEPSVSIPPESPANLKAEDRTAAEPADSSSSRNLKDFDQELQVLLAKQLAKLECYPITRPLLDPTLGPRDAGYSEQIGSSMQSFWQSNDAKDRILKLKNAIKGLASDDSASRNTRQQMADCAEKLLGMFALSAVNPAALPSLLPGEDGLLKLPIGTAIGVELCRATAENRTEVTFKFVLVKDGEKEVEWLRGGGQIELNTSENGWGQTQTINDIVTSVVKSKTEFAGGSLPPRWKIEEVSLLLTEDRMYFSVSPWEHPRGHPLFNAEICRGLRGVFPNQDIVHFGDESNSSPHGLFRVGEGELSGAIRLCLKAIDDLRQA